ncbi:MAG: hypothetical protein KF708_20500 [Pirellulales bacterium]|nr:hypothetical protein [Pirellulales bacterium]
MSGRLGLMAAALLGMSVCSCRDASAQGQGPQPGGRPQAPQLKTDPRLTQQQPTRQMNQAAPGGPQQPPAQPGQPQGFSQPEPQAPFQLSREEQQALDRILLTWQNTSGKIESMQCTIYRWESNPVFGKNTRGAGQLKYTAPDKGKYYVEELNDQGKPVGVSEHWVCDGNAIYEFDHGNRKLVVRQLPNELKGKAIADGPLPFLFGADANKMKARYWIRQIAPPEAHQEKICLEAFPKFQRDAANFRRAEVMLDAQWVPFALMLELPDGKSRTTHQFANVSTNSWFEKIKGEIIKDTSTPLGWTRIDEHPPAAQPPVAGQPAPGAPTGQPAPRTAQQPQPAGTPR